MITARARLEWAPEEGLWENSRGAKDARPSSTRTGLMARPRARARKTTTLHARNMHTHHMETVKLLFTKKLGGDVAHVSLF